MFPFVPDGTGARTVDGVIRPGSALVGPTVAPGLPSAADRTQPGSHPALASREPVSVRNTYLQRLAPAGALA
jgi:hypothetical protein